MTARLPWAALIVAGLALVAGLVIHPSSIPENAYLPPIAVPFAIVGALLSTRRAKNPIGWLFLAFGVVASCVFLFAQYSGYAFQTQPPRAGADLAAALSLHLWHPSFGLFVSSFLLFPNGHLVSPRWRWAMALALVTYGGLALSGPFDTGFLNQVYPEASPLVGGTLGEVGTAIYANLLGFNLLVLPLSAASLVVRLRRSRGQERQQVKVFVYTAATVIFAFPLILVGTGTAYGVLLFGLIPVSAGVAILRHRLYDIDVVINRTLVYGALTATLAGAYLGLVLLAGLTVGESDLATAVSTLAVAALFRPARARIQAGVDRRFYRHRYDAARTLEAFSARLRDELDLEALGADLRGVAHDTVQPAHVSLWLRSPA